MMACSRQLASYLLLLTTVCLCTLAGCTPPVVRHANATSWQPTRQLSEDERMEMSVVVLGETVGPDGACRVIRDSVAKASQCPLEDRALLLATCGITAVHFGATDEAKRALDESLRIMEAIIYDPAKAQEILSLSGEERTKVFKGEPHERAVCNLYRGLLYLADGDFENARACFLAGEMQSRRSTDDAMGNGTWVSLEYLQALSDELCPSQRGLRFPSELPQGIELGSFGDGDDTLLVVVGGFAPAKIHERTDEGFGLSYVQMSSRFSGFRVRENPVASSGPSPSATRPHPTSQPASNVDTWNNELFPVCLRHPSEDLYVQALSNGRREMDKVLQAKERLARQRDAGGDTAEGVAMVSSQFGIYGLPVTLIALIAGSSSRDAAAKADATADVRQITALPGCIGLAGFKAPGKQVAIEALDSNGSVICSKQVAIGPPANGGINVVVVRVYM